MRTVPISKQISSLYITGLTKLTWSLIVGSLSELGTVQDLNFLHHSSMLPLIRPISSKRKTYEILAFSLVLISPSVSILRRLLHLLVRWGVGTPNIQGQEFLPAIDLVQVTGAAPLRLLQSIVVSHHSESNKQNRTGAAFPGVKDLGHKTRSTELLGQTEIFAPA